MNLKEYKKHLEKEAKEFKLTSDDLSNLYDLFHIVDNPKEIPIDFKETLKLNKMESWFNNFLERLEEVIITELK